MRGWTLGVCVVAALAMIALTPDLAWAWTPGTHVYLGEAVLRAPELLPPNVAELIRAFSYDFLYGSIAADTSIAKKYAVTGRNCHAWPVGLDIYDKARDDPLRAFALGYLSHLAADVVAHNYFVPYRLTVTSSTVTIGHSYWENRFETHLGDRVSRRARELILLDHSRSDAHLDRILSPTIFSTPTNRRIFRGMVRAADSDSWQRIFQLVSERSRWDLVDIDIGLYLDRAFNFVVDVLSVLDKSEPHKLDPSGARALRMAKRVRREALVIGGVRETHRAAGEHFSMPTTALGYAQRLTVPLYPPPAGGTRAASN
ncbi:MAG TPA: zinc dependent phospholipase C family protein [Gemmatimonadaceae bacterium]|nr:zinc dependent phospholipase C family protein [Gemmatimonadaceae bacterium]